MIKKIKKVILSFILVSMLNLITNISVFAAIKSDTNKLSPLEAFLNFFNDIWTNYSTIILIIGALIFISLLDAFYCFVVKARESVKYLKELDLERERYHIVVEQLNDIIFDFDLVEKKISSSSKFEEKFGWTLNIQNYYSKNFLKDFRIHPEDEVLVNKIFDDMRALNKQSIIKQIRLMKSNGEYLWCELKLNYIQRKDKIIRVIGKITDIDNIIREHSLLKLKSEYDQLTKVYNKSAFYDKVRRYIEENKEENCILVFIDLDNFKAINDNLGHMVGDEVLVDTANKICDIFNSTEAVVSRFGGDEFCVFNPSISLSIIKERINALCDNLNATYIYKESKITVSASIGVAFYPKHGETLESLIHKSDIALYKSKENGKNQFTIYDSKLELTC